MTVQCERCGERHGGPPYALSTPLPDPIAALSRAERERRAIVGDHNAALDDFRFFVRGRMTIGARDSGEPVFAWGLWVELDRRDYKRTLARWQLDDRAPVAGRLASAVPGHDSTVDLSVELVGAPPGEPPIVRLRDGEHALAREQAGGIDPARAAHILALALHGQGHP